MAAPAAVLAILVEANTKQANAALADTNARLAATAAESKAATASTSKLGPAMRKVGTVAKWAALGGIAAFAIEAHKAVQTTQDLTKSTISLHKNLGLSNKAASEWAGLARARGADSTKLGMAFKTLATQVSAAGHGSATASAMLKELGFSQKDVQKAMTDTQFAVTKVSDGLNALPAGADKATISGKLFGRGWQTIAPILRDGSKAMNEQLDTVKKYGGVLQGSTLKAQKDLLASTRENSLAWQGLQVQLATVVTPALQKIDEQFQHVAAIIANPKLTQDQKLSKVAAIVQKDFSKALDFIISLIPQIANKVGETAPKIAAALVTGFLHADVWGKLALGAWLVTKLGLTKALLSGIGTRIAGGIAGGTAAGAAAGETAGTTVGARFLAGFGGKLLGAAGIAFAIKEALSTKGGILDDLSGNGSANLGPGLGKKVGNEFIKGLNESLTAGGGKISASTQKIISDLKQVPTFVDGQFVPQIKGGLDDLRGRFGSLANAGAALSKSQRKSWLEIAQAAADNGQISQRSVYQMQQAFEKGSGRMKDAWQRLADSVGISTDKMKNKVSDSAKKEIDAISSFGHVATSVLRAVSDDTNKQLKQWGVAEINFAATQTASSPGHHRVGLARGGLVPGSGSGDTVPAMLTPGEGVIRKDVVAAMGGAKAINALNAQHFAKGGVVQMPGVNMSVGQEPTILKDLGGLSRVLHEAIYVISGYRSPAHSVAVGGFANDPHTQGAAADIGAGSPTLASMFGVAEATLRKVGLYRPFYPADPHEVNHVQLTGGGASGPAAALKKIARFMWSGPNGALKGIGQSQSDHAVKAANAFLAKKAGGLGATGTGGGSSANEALGRRMMLAAGWGPSQWPSLDSLWMQESGWNANAVNPSSGAYGIPQSLGHGHPYDLGDARAQIAWGLNYIRGRYGSPSAAWGHEQAYNWYGGGADFIARRPQLIGVGDGGPERVQVTPLGGGNARSGGNVYIDTAVMSDPLDAQRLSADWAFRLAHS